MLKKYQGSILNLDLIAVVQGTGAGEWAVIVQHRHVTEHDSNKITTAGFLNPKLNIFRTGEGDFD